MKLATKTLLASTAALVTLGLAGTADAATVTAYLDFGDASTTGNAGGVQYNDIAIDGSADGINVAASLQVNGAPGTTSPAPLLDTDGNATGWGFQAMSLNTAGTLADNGAGGSSQYGGPYPSELAGIEATALRSMWFFNRGKDIQLTFSGLNDSYNYSFAVYGASQQVGNATNSIVTGVPVTGIGTDFVSKTMNTWLNDDEIIGWSGISPVGGEITFNLEGSRESWLNFISITTPEPTSFVAGLAMGGLCILRRRRRD